MLPPHRLILMASFTVFCLLSARSQDPANLPPGQLQRAEQTYRELYGAGHDKALKAAKLSDKSEFAKKLWEAAQSAKDDPALQEVLRKNALIFAQNDATGNAVALEVHRAYLAFPSRKAQALDKIAGIQERALAAEPIANRPASAAAIVRTYREAIAEYERLGNPSAALAALNKARTLARRYMPVEKNIHTALDNDEKRLQLASAEFADIERFRGLLEKNPADVPTRAALGCRYLRLHRTADAVAQFAGTGDADWKGLAAALEQKPVKPLELAQRALIVAPNLPPMDRKSRYSLLEYARVALESVRAKSAQEWLECLPTYSLLLDKMTGLEPAFQTPRLATSSFLAQYDLAEVLQERGMFPEALNAVQKARVSLKIMKPADAKDFLPELDQLEKSLKSRVSLGAEIARLQMAAGMLEAKDQLALGLGLLRTGKTYDAAKPLAASGAKAWEAVARLAMQGDKANPLEFGNALREAANELKGDEKADILGLARLKYEQYLATAGASAERTRIELLAQELPRSSVLVNSQKPFLLTTPEYVRMMPEQGLGPSKNRIQLDGMVLTTETEYANLFDARWKYKVTERPLQKNEVRYIGYLWKTDNFNATALVYQGSNYRGYVAGRNHNDPKLIWISPDVPKEWTVVLRDLHKDFGAMEITGLGLGSVDKGPTHFAAVYVGASMAQVRRAVLRAQPE